MDDAKPAGGDAKVVDLEFLMATRDFGIQQTTTLLTLIIASVFGIFSILLIIQAGPKPDVGHGHAKLPFAWIVFTIAYFVAGALTLVLFAVTMMFTRLTVASVQRIGEMSPDRTQALGQMLQEAATGPGSNWVTRLALRIARSRGAPRYSMGGALGLVLLVAMWAAVSFP